ncbi:MAG: FAD binding domain-containing protein [Bacteroidetes bacterium]|nr:FAD binding domain-containing protein [Bacteroidota bacterium]MBL6943294.1 FAD binding domain-containing protein [Bacteroidales bacterium]
MIEFILNKEHIKTEIPSGSILLDFIRQKKHLTGTKIGCREGDCGACTVLSGSLNTEGKVDYKAITSCLTPIASVHGKHVVTIEGLNLTDGLTTVQNAIKENNATQCGFCTPGFVVSLTGYALNKNISITGIKDSISGNICRCTGYKSIEKATEDITSILVEKNNHSTKWLIERKFVPEYFTEIPGKLFDIKAKMKINSKGTIVGGGTDLYVTRANKFQELDVDLISENDNINKIFINKNTCIIGAGATVSDILNFTRLHDYFPELENYFKLISSKQIRNMATVGGNLVNASPIADLAIFFLALNSKININDKQGGNRIIFLKDFFKGYKSIDINDGEIIQEITFELPEDDQYFNFEKVSKRTHLDIASVNSAMNISIKKKLINDIYLSAGGVSPIPLFLKNTCSFLKGKVLSSENIQKAHCVLKEEITPISDVRGSKGYKRLLIRQLYYGHFIKLFPDIINIYDIK